MHKYFCILLFLFICSGCLRAQSNYGYPADSSYNTISKKDQPNKQDINGKDPDRSLVFMQPVISPDTIKSWKALKAFEYARYLDSLLQERQDRVNVKRKDYEDTGPGWLDKALNASATRVIFWTLAVGFVGFIGYRLFLTEGIFKRPAASLHKPDTTAAEEPITGEHELDSHISQAVLAGNFRLAVRYQYLKTLYKLANGNIITMAAGKTNLQYVREIGKRTLQNDFSFLTLSYEYVWYGELNIDSGIYSRLLPRFTEFNRKILPVT